eukprot:FR742081.1.p1 GENE.FR742081.1~~FR742081.1.p1  ORF type:complete len:266 (+),score=30.50 FR742081.1:98-895(+)
MPLLYSLVSRGRTVLAEHTDSSGNFPTVTRLLLGKIDDQKPGRVSYLYDQYMFHYHVENSIIYLCMTSADEGSQGQVRMPYAFLEDIKGLFLGQYGESAQTAIAFQMNGSFAPVLETRMRHYNEDFGQENAGIQKVNDKLEKVKGVMVQNIEAVLERREVGAACGQNRPAAEPGFPIPKVLATIETGHVDEENEAVRCCCRHDRAGRLRDLRLCLRLDISEMLHRPQQRREVKAAVSDIMGPSGCQSPPPSSSLPRQFFEKVLSA